MKVSSRSWFQSTKDWILLLLDLSNFPKKAYDMRLSCYTIVVLCCYISPEDSFQTFQACKLGHRQWFDSTARTHVSMQSNKALLQIWCRGLPCPTKRSNNHNRMFSISQNQTLKCFKSVVDKKEWRRSKYELWAIAKCHHSCQCYSQIASKLSG